MLAIQYNSHDCKMIGKSRFQGPGADFKTERRMCRLQISRTVEEQISSQAKCLKSAADCRFQELSERRFQVEANTWNLLQIADFKNSEIADFKSGKTLEICCRLQISRTVKEQISSRATRLKSAADCRFQAAERSDFKNVSDCRNLKNRHEISAFSWNLSRFQEIWADFKKQISSRKQNSPRVTRYGRT